jgi:hypothetical protein
MLLLRTFWLSCYLILSILLPTTSAYPNGAGACPGGVSAVNGTHVDMNKRQVIKGSLRKGLFRVTINNSRRLRRDHVTKIATNKVHRIQVSSIVPPGTTFKGILIRSEVLVNNTILPTSTLTPVGTYLQVEPTCTALANAAVRGVSHNSNVAKSVAEADLFITGVGTNTNTVKLDITIVVANNVAQSISYYTGFTLQAKPKGAV